MAGASSIEWCAPSTRVLAQRTGRPSDEKQKASQPSSVYWRVQADSTSHGPTASSSPTSSKRRIPIWRRRPSAGVGSSATWLRVSFIGEASPHAALLAPVKQPGFDRAPRRTARGTFRRVMVGREPERQLLSTLVERARGGSAGTLVMRGEAGVGKSALLDVLVAGVGDATVLRTHGLDAEAQLEFAALHRLLRPITRLRRGLPEPQARALRVAFGEEEGAAVEPFLVGVATLSILTTAAEENPVLCLVDDAHWLDAATAGALLFCAHRLGADRVALVFAARDGAWGTFDPQGLRELVVT